MSRKDLKFFFLVIHSKLSLFSGFRLLVAALPGRNDMMWLFACSHNRTIFQDNLTEVDNQIFFLQLQYFYTLKQSESQRENMFFPLPDTGVVHGKFVLAIEYWMRNGHFRKKPLNIEH